MMTAPLSSLDLDDTRKAFDAAAGVYDVAYEDLPGIRRFRMLTREIYLRFFPPTGTLLDLNCGTGNDSIYLARRGFHILGADISGGMIERAQAKVASEGLDEFVQAIVLPFHGLSSLHGKTFDGAYSNMGGLNCSDSLGTIARDLADLLRPGGYFIATVMPSFCLWETLAALARGNGQLAFRRHSADGTIANVHGGNVRTFYYSPSRMKNLFAPYFEHVKTTALGVILPPPNHVRAYKLLGRSLHLLEGLDTLLSQFVLSSFVSDHYVMVLRRKRL